MGGKSGGGYRAPVEAPNSLQSMQEVTIVEAVSEGPIVGLATGDAKSIALNETPLMTDEGAYTYQNVSWAIRLGTSDQDAFADVSGVETETTVGVEVTKYFPRASGSGSGAVTRQITNPYCTAVRITMSVGALYEQLVDQDRAGDTVAMTVSYNVRITDNNNSVVVSDDVERTDKTTSGAQWAKKYTLTGSAPWTVTVTKTYDDNTSGYKHNDIYWAAYTEIIGYKMIYPHTACMMVRGNAETFGSSVPNRAYKIKGLIVEVPNNYDPETRQYSGIWDGTFKNAWTDNPAWVLRDIIESGRYGLKKFFPPAKQGNALCDKWTLYEIAKYCDEYVSDGEGGLEPRCRFNGQIMGSGTAREVLQSIASNFHGMMYWGSGMVMASSDVPKDPIKSLTQANVIDGAITYSTGSAQERHSVALVTWYDPDNYGNARIEPVYDWDAYQRYGYRPINVTAYGCTSRAQAHRQGLWTLLTEDEQWQASCVVGLDGYDLMPGDFVRIADPHWMGTRFSGRIESIDGTSVTLDGEVSFASGENYVLYVVMPDGTEEHRDITTGAGTHTTITIQSAFSKTPVDHAVWTISGTDIAPRLFAVRSIEEQEAGKLKLSLREVMSSKYERLEQSITFTTTPGRRPTVGVLAAPTGLTVVPANYISGGQVYQRLTFSWVGSGDSAVSEYEFGYRSPAGDWNSFAPKKTFSMDIAAAASGTYLFRVRALSLDGRQSSWAEKSYELAGVTTVPKAPTNLSAVGGYRSIQVRWQMPSDALIGYFEILMADSDSLEDAELVGKIYGSSFDVMDLGIMETKWFWVRSVSYADGGIYSEAVGPVSATTKALEMTEIPEASIDESKLLPSLAEKIQSVDDSSNAISLILNAIEEDKNASSRASIQQVSQIVRGENGLVAQWYVKTDVNGRIAGFGHFNDGQVAEFAVLADRFFIAKADGTATPVFEVDSVTGLVQLIGSLIASGSLTGRELNAAAKMQLGAGGQFIAGSGAIVQIGTEGNNAAMLFDSETGRIVIKDPNNLTTGDYISMAVGDISTYKYLSGSYRQMKSLRKMEVGIGINGQVVTLPGYWPSQPKIQVSPYALQCYDSNYPGQNQQLKCYADAIAYNDGVVTFVPRAYLEIAAGNSYVGSPVSVHAQTIGKTPAAEDASIPITVNSDTYSSVPNGSVNIAVQVKVYAQIISNFVIEGDIFSGYVTRYTYSPVKVTVTAHLGNASLVLGVHTFAAALKDLSSEPTSEYVTFSGTFSNGSGSVYISAYIEIAETSVITSTQFNGAPSRCWLRLDSITWGLQGSTQLASGTLNYVAIAE